MSVVPSVGAALMISPPLYCQQGSLCVTIESSDSLAKSQDPDSTPDPNSREKLYTSPPPPPRFGQKTFFRERGGGVYVSKPPAAGFYTPPHP